MKFKYVNKGLFQTATSATVTMSMLLSMALPVHAYAATETADSVKEGVVESTLTSSDAPVSDVVAPDNTSPVASEGTNDSLPSDTSSEQPSVGAVDTTTLKPLSAAPAPETVLAAADAAPTSDTATEPVSQTSIWIDDNTATTYDTINAAVAAAQAGQTIHVKGDFTNNSAAILNTNVNKAVTLEIAGNTTMVGTRTTTYTTATSAADGITMSSSSRLTVVPGATLNMKYFNRAIRVQDNAVLADGHYNLSQNYTGFSYGSTKAIEGSTGRDSIVVNSTESPIPLAYNSKLVKNATFNLVASKNSSGSYAESSFTWNFENVSWTEKNTWLYLGAYTIKNSDVFYATAPESGHRQGITFEGAYTIENSNVTFDGNNRNLVSAIISHTAGGNVPTSTLRNSVMNIQNARGFGGGYNLGIGKVDVIDSTINVSNITGPALGANYAGYDGTNTSRFKFEGSSILNTPMKSSYDSIGANPGDVNPTIVMGGAYKWYWNAKDPDVGNTPVNSEEHGSERLTLLSLKDISINELQPLDKNGVAYTYPVVNATDDGAKRVWVPAAKVTFKLGNDSASFADGSKANKTQSTIRGYKLEDVLGNEDPGTPTDANGVAFLGWFYKDAKGTEHAFAYGDKITQDTEVYAKWDSKQLVYHNGAGIDVIESVKKTDTSAVAISYEAASQNKEGFAVAGKNFVAWNTAPDGSGTSYAPGDAIALGEGDTRVDLYAQYEDQHYTVSFSANGGYFSESSVFAQNPDKFDLIKNDKGQIVEARLKETALYNETLSSILPEGITRANLAIPAGTASRMGNAQQTDYWYTDASATDSIRFDDYRTSFFGISWTVDGSDPQITSNTTYYVGWKENVAASDKITATVDLSADMWGQDAAKSAQVEAVYPGDKDLSVTGMINISKIKDQIQEIQNQFGSNIKDLQNIALEGLKSTFTATLRLPEGVHADPEQVSKDAVQVAGLGDLFEVTDAKLDGQVITITFGVKPGITNFQQLKDAVLSMGVAAPSTASRVRRARAIASTGDQLRVSVSGLSIDEAASGDLTAIGEVTGSFESYAQYGGKVKKFAFNWTSSQADDGKNGESSAISYTWRAPVATSHTLPGDLLINGNTEHDQVYYALPDATLTYTGTIDVSSIKTQMSAIEDQFGETDPFTDINLSRTQSGFVATITFPEGLILPDEVSPTLEGSRAFKVSEVNKDGQTITVRMDLTGEYNTYKQLKDTITAEDDLFKLSIPGITLAEDAQGTYTTTGTLTGSFNSIATKNETTKPFAFKWNAVQTDEGRDAAASEATSDAITATVNVVKPQTISLSAKLKGDILMGNDTGHDALTQVERGQQLEFTGHLNTDPIVTQIDAYADSFGGNIDGILTKDINSTFVATFTVDQSLKMPEDLSAILSQNDLFEISDVAVNDHTITVTMKLKKTYEKFADLKKDVDAIKGLDLTLGKFTVPNDAQDQTTYTVSGEVTGTFTGFAYVPNSDKARVYDLKWNTEQSPEGSDFALGEAPDLSLIQYTVQANVPAPEPEPEQPTPGDKNNEPDQPTTPEASNVTSQNKEADQLDVKHIPDTSDAAASTGLIASVIAALGAMGIGASRKQRRK